MTLREIFRRSRIECCTLAFISLVMPTIDFVKGKFMTFWGLPQIACYLMVATALVLASVLVSMHVYWLKNVWRKQ